MYTLWYCVCSHTLYILDMKSRVLCWFLVRLRLCSFIVSSCWVFVNPVSDDHSPYWAFSFHSQSLHNLSLCSCRHLTSLSLFPLQAASCTTDCALSNSFLNMKLDGLRCKCSQLWIIYTATKLCIGGAIRSTSLYMCILFVKSLFLFCLYTHSLSCSVLISFPSPVETSNLRIGYSRIPTPRLGWSWPISDLPRFGTGTNRSAWMLHVGRSFTSVPIHYLADTRTPVICGRWALLVRREYYCLSIVGLKRLRDRSTCALE